MTTTKCPELSAEWIAVNANASTPHPHRDIFLFFVTSFGEEVLAAFAIPAYLFGIPVYPFGLVFSRFGRVFCGFPPIKRMRNDPNRVFITDRTLLAMAH